MYIVQVSPNDGRGGAERIALDLHRGYRAAGHDATMLVGQRLGRGPGVEPLDPAHRPPPRQGPLSRLLGRDPPGHPATAKLLDRLDRPADVLHLNNLHGAGGYFDLRELPRLSRLQPTVITPHDAWLFTGGPTYALGRPTPRQRRRLAHRAALFAESELHLVCSSRWMLRQAEGSPLGPHLRSTRVIPVGVDLAAFHPPTADERAVARTALNLDADRPAALFVAHHAHRHPYKDLAALRAAMGRCRHRVTLLVAGTPGKQERVGRSVIRYLGGLADDASLVACYYAADVLIHAAKADNFPNVVLEAMACGLPVVATAVGGIPEQVEDGETGRLVPPHDPEAFAEALDALLDDPADAAIFGAAGRRRVETHHDLTQQAAENLRHYEALRTL